MIINRRNSPLFAEGKARWDKFVTEYKGPYDFSSSVYVGMNRKVSFQCPVHGLMQSDAKVMVRGAKCQKCVFEDRRGKRRITQGQMLERFIKAHGQQYDYSQAVYSTQQVPVHIICPDHGAFFQCPEWHWAGSKCPGCAHDSRKKLLSLGYEGFVEVVERNFPGMFDVPMFNYTNSQAEIQIVCRKHKKVCSTKPNWVIMKNNPCTQCNHMKSAEEAAIAKFCGLFTKVSSRNRSLLAPKEVDIYMPSKHLAIEFSGMFWHSHPDEVHENGHKMDHANKFYRLRDMGIRLITVFQSEWRERPYAIKRLLRNAIGAGRGKLMARKCELKNVPHKEAVAFYERYHPQGGAGHGDHYGLYWKGKLVACMRFTFGANDRGAARAGSMWTLTRYATRITVAGGASRLFKAFVNDKNPGEVKSFSDNRYFSGGMYTQLGFTLEEETKPDYQVWSPKIGLAPKSHYQRRLLPKRLQEHGSTEVFDPETDTRTEKEMTYAMGARRIYDCGKKRWVWNPSQER
jgi:hypothetical protein